MSRPLTLLALVWAPFLSIFVFASQGDTSALHITSHLLALALLTSLVAVRRVLRLDPLSATTGAGIAL